MRDKIQKIAVMATIILLAGCTGTKQTATGTGVLLKNELSSNQMQPGGTVLLRTSINNFFDNELKDAKAKLTRTFGQLGNNQNLVTIGTVQANPNATSRAQWQLDVKRSASDGTVFTNKVRVCFNYEQTAWHELSLVNSFDIDSLITSGTETGPLSITFSGLDKPYVYNDDVQSQIPISISIKNNYPGYVGTIDMSKDEIPTLDKVELRIYDAGYLDVDEQHDSELGNCDDGINNDNDSIIVGCDDTDETCAETNDIAAIDCLDADCYNSDACQNRELTEEGEVVAKGEGNCNDGEDNDMDDATDCNDADCKYDPACFDKSIEVSCSNYRDDDKDGKYDCEDSDCKTEKACQDLQDSVPEHFNVISSFNNPSELNCDTNDWDNERGFIKCEATNLEVFGDETFLGTKLDINQLETEELIQLIEVVASYNYCIESEDFSIDVFVPGGN